MLLEEDSDVVVGWIVKEIMDVVVADVVVACSERLIVADVAIDTNHISCERCCWKWIWTMLEDDLDAVAGSGFRRYWKIIWMLLLEVEEDVIAESGRGSGRC